MRLSGVRDARSSISCQRLLPAVSMLSGIGHGRPGAVSRIETLTPS
jgi:hypothetical protein